MIKSSTSGQTGALILDAPQIILILIAALYLIPATGAISCFKCEYGPTPADEAGKDLPCKKENLPEPDSVLECDGHHKGCYTVHWRGVKDGKKYVKGHGGCLQLRDITKCVADKLESGAFAESQVYEHADQRKCISAKVPGDAEDYISSECLRHPSNSDPIGEDLEIDVCPCNGDRCNDGSPLINGGRTVGKSPQSLGMTIAVFAVTTGDWTSSEPLASHHIVMIIVS